MQKLLEKHYRWIIAATLLFMATVSLLNAWNDTLIFDEDAHTPAGYSYIALHDMRLNPEHPPLLKDLAGLAILPFHPKFDTTKDFWTEEINGQWEAGHDLFWQEGNDADQLMFWSRIPFVILSLIFVLFIFKWTRELAGISAGLFAMVLAAFDPNILGHNHFVTTDLGIAAFMTFSFYYFLKFVKDPSWKNVAIGGLFLGLVQLAKFSSITLFPIYGLVLLIYPLVKRKRNPDIGDLSFRMKKLGEYLGKGAVAFAVSLVVVWGVYAANIYEMPESKLADTIEYYFPANDNSPAARATNKIAMSLNQSAYTRPLSEYFLGIAMVFKRVDGGNGAYFIGKVSSQAFPAYFPTVFLLKEPLPSLAFMLFALGITFGRNAAAFAKSWKLEEKSRRLADYIRHHIKELSMFGFIVLYSYISITGNLNIGFRHLFPILPFIYILTAKTIFDFLKRRDEHSRFVWGFCVFFGALFLAAGTAAAYPSYMSYFNRLAGGSQNGYKYVTDSNADWGQDLKRLKNWVNDYNYCGGMKCDANLKVGCPKLCYTLIENPSDTPKTIEKIHLNYFGGADIKYYFGDTAIDWWDSRRPLEPGFYALSTNYLMGSIYDKTKPDNESYRWTEKFKPVAQVGTSIFVYYLTPEETGMINSK